MDGGRLVEAVRKLVNPQARTTIYNRAHIVLHPTSSAGQGEKFSTSLVFFALLMIFIIGAGIETPE